jgi:uncharacterized protein YcbK (DUF882 family)
MATRKTRQPDPATTAAPPKASQAPKAAKTPRTAKSGKTGRTGKSAAPTAVQARSVARGTADALPSVASYRCAEVTPLTRISEHFTVRELIASEVAQRNGIDNRFETDAHLQAAVHLARTVLEPLRAHHGGPLSPNSVYRSQAVERALKNRPGSWISTSAHTTGCACDMELPGLSTLALAQWAAEHLADYDQIICECYDPSEGVNSGWVHIAVLPPGQGVNRREQLSYVRDPKTRAWVYVTGFRAA